MVARITHLEHQSGEIGTYVYSVQQHTWISQKVFALAHKESLRAINCICSNEATVCQTLPWPISCHFNIALLRHGVLCISTLVLIFTMYKINKCKIFFPIVFFVTWMALLIPMFTKLLLGASIVNPRTSHFYVEQ